MAVRIALLSIGDELLLGEITDTNATHISASLYDLGLIPERLLTVGDREEEIVAALLELSEVYDLVIATGGLGPTADDVTARAVAKAAGRRLVLNDEALAHLRDFRGGGPLHPGNEKQALLP